MKYKIGQKVYYFTRKSDGVILWHDNIRSLRGNRYSFVTSASDAFTKDEEELFETEKDALNWVKRSLGKGEGVYNAE